jgi:ArsR family transcriptional regulator, arsenate/arsenite/antimonite-responsive transcriptional repressor
MMYFLCYLISMHNDMRRSVKILKAVSDRNRLRVIKLLQHKDGACVCEIQKILGVGQSTTSRHLKILEEADLIYQIREGKWINYFLNTKCRDTGIRSLLKMLEKWVEEDRMVQIDRRTLLTVDRVSLCNGR